MKRQPFIITMSFLFVIIFSNVCLAKIDTVTTPPWIVKGKHLAMSIFKVDEKKLRPHIAEGYEPILDQNGNARITLAMVNISAAFGLKPYQEVIVFTEIKPANNTSNQKLFLPLLAAFDHNEVAAAYKNALGLPVLRNPKLTVSRDKDQFRAELKSADEGLVHFIIEKQAGEPLTQASSTQLFGMPMGKAKLSNDSFIITFNRGKLTHLNIQSGSNSVLALIKASNALYSLVSEDHVAFIE